MIELIIDNKKIKVKEGTTVLNAAKQLGIEIPTMCFLDGMTNHPSCMLCVVKDVSDGKLHPSCALPANSGMEIITNDNEIFDARKEALELLLSDHVGDCEAPCRPSCPANMNIPLMNRLIAEGKHREAIEVVKKDIALPLILGYICPAPCEKACRRKQIDKPVSICALKKNVAAHDIDNDTSYMPKKAPSSGKKVAIIGSGPAGLSCAYYTLSHGHHCVIFDKNAQPGGTLRYDIPDDKLPKHSLNSEIEIIKKLGAEFRMNIEINKELFKSELTNQYDAIVIAMGNFGDTNLVDFGFKSTKYGLQINRDTFEVDTTGVFACGNIIRSRRMAITSVAQGKSAATSVNQYLKGESIQKKKRMFNSKFGKLYDSEFEEYLKEGSDSQRIELPDGKMGDFSTKQSTKEASRCMHCDCRKPNTCKLRIYSDEYDADRKKFLFGERKKIKIYNKHNLINYEPEKCIRCNICVEITAKQKESIGFTSIGRGFDIEINMPLNRSISEILTKTALLCAKECPTGAISRK